MIRLIEKSDINDLALIYKDLYDNVDIGENWSIESATNLLTYWYSKQKDLFFVDVENAKPVGAIVSGVKNWFDGIRLIDTEIFVAKSHQNKGIANKLLLQHLIEAKLKYNAKTIEFHTYGDETEFPQNWYNRIGMQKDQELIIMNGEVENIIKNLGADINKIQLMQENNGKANEQYIKPFAYNELTDLYSDLKTGDNAYIFDMLPEYSYLENEDEINYLLSRNIAIKNGAHVELYFIGSKDKFITLIKNELFKQTLLSNPNIVILYEEELKEKISYHFFQLGKGLYYGERKNGDVEVFRDLWTSNDIGIFYKNVETNKVVKTTIDVITEKLKNKELINYYSDITERV